MKTSNAVRLAVLTALYGTAAWSADAVTDADATATATASATASANDAADNLQEVTVTATRREASAQDLPMSITAVSGSQLESAGIPTDRISVAALCTASDRELFCSYRRDGSATGRMAAAIRSRPPRHPWRRWRGDRRAR